MPSDNCPSYRSGVVERRRGVLGQETQLDHAPVVPSEIRRVLANQAEPQAAVAELAELVHRAGAPDNVVLVVADVLA